MHCFEELIDHSLYALLSFHSTADRRKLLMVYGTDKTHMIEYDLSLIVWVRNYPRHDIHSPR